MAYFSKYLPINQLADRQKYKNIFACPGLNNLKKINISLKNCKMFEHSALKIEAMY